MKLLNDWVSENFLHALGWTLVHSIWQLGLLAGILWIVLKFTPKANPASKYLVSVGILLLSLGVTLATFSYEFTQGKSSKNLTIEETQFLLSNYQSVEIVPVISTITKASIWVEQTIPHLVNFWFIGAILFLLRLFGNLSELRNLRRFSSPISDFQLEKITYRLAEKMGIKSSVQLRITESGLSPLTFGTFRPVIILPACLIFQLSPVQLEAILAHELAHVKRKDYLVNLLLSGLEVIFFYHPCYWWMNQTVKELRENAADDLAIRAGILPKNLATGLAEVLNYSKQNPPELAQAAAKKRNPTLQRIKRILGYPAQNYPQNPIISIPMLLTLFLSLGLMASAQQDAPKSSPKAPIKPNQGVIAPAFPENIAFADTIRANVKASPKATWFDSSDNSMFISNGGTFYRISGDTVFSNGDTVILSGKSKMALDQFRNSELPPLDALEIPMTPMYPIEMELAPLPDFYFEFQAPEIEAMAMDLMEPMPPFPPFDFAFEVPNAFPFDLSDTTKSSALEYEKLAKEAAKKSEEWAKLYEAQSKEWMERWKAGEQERAAKMDAWKKEFEPKMKEFELKMKEWQAAQEPKMKEFELKMKEWEATQKPRMEEFQKKMEVWQKEHQNKLQEFQKLLQEELQKKDN